jgi:hypothetical protein
MNSIAMLEEAWSSRREIEDLRLDGDVERRGRLVRDQKARVADQRHWRSSPRRMPPESSWG